MPNHAPLCSKHRPRSGKPRPAPARAQVSGRDPRGVQRGELGMMVLWDSGDHGEAGGLGGGVQGGMLRGMVGVAPRGTKEGLQ